MRILLLTEVFHPETIGGSGRYMRDLGRALARAGHEPWLLTRNPGGRLPAEETREGIRIIRYRVPERALPWLPAMQRFSVRRAAANLASKVRFDVVHAQQPLVASAALAVPALANLPWVYTFQSPWHEEYLIKKGKLRPGETAGPSLAARAMREVEASVVRRVQQLIVLSSYSQRRVRELHAPPAPITRIPGGVDLDHFRPEPSRAEARRLVGLSENRRVLFTARNLVPRMGLENLIESVAHLKDHHPDVQLVIGGHGPLAEALQAQVERLDLTDTVCLTGRIDESRLPFYYRAADLFVLPTAQLEGFGLVTVEALASGTPVIATPVGGSLDILGPFHRGSLATGSDTAALTERIHEFLGQREAWPSEIECREYAENEFSWASVADRTQQIYEAACARRAKSPRPSIESSWLGAQSGGKG